MSGFVFDYTTGDPDNLTGGGDAAMIDIQGSFFDVRTWLNSGVLDQLAASLYIVGEIRHLAGPPPSAAWIPCDGRSLTQSAYTKLFNAIGTTYGPGAAPGSTFNLPDLRGRAAVGAGAGTGLTSRAAGAKGGSEPANMPSHVHGSANGQAFMTSTLTVGLNGDSGAQPSWFPDGWTGPTAAAGGGNDGFGQPVSNMPPFLAIPAYIYAGT